MSVDIPDVTPATPDYASALQQVVAAKAAWRKHAQSLTWEEKVAAIERMWVRDRELKKIRERNVVSMKAN
jgi:hypothetical protein